ncbi:hypothetical protein KIH87_07580 [Paraneptunicella aestuarii]|uniref:hypothetical protein n=1 Tax=Paraneptunicella aestuarii TaxID=2831148 RepID=UPI001E647867|nr:hypothetical protein [Paraneptunicella aestuarii]UAA40191.1 hypothetical protein KIH87_07580 [Paraneptunicella aestuarii]
MKSVKTLLIASLTALVISNNVQAEQNLFNTQELHQAVASNIELAINDIATPEVPVIVKQELNTMSLEQNVNQFLAMAKFDRTKQKPNLTLISE